MLVSFSGFYNRFFKALGVHGVWKELRFKADCASVYKFPSICRRRGVLNKFAVYSCTPGMSVYAYLYVYLFVDELRKFPEALSVQNKIVVVSACKPELRVASVYSIALFCEACGNRKECPRPLLFRPLGSCPRQEAYSFRRLSSAGDPLRNRCICHPD